MLDNLMNELEKLSAGQQFRIDLPLDENGYFDRKCPNENCSREFKIKFDDYRNIVRDEVVYCPICKHEKPATEWNTQEQFEYIKSLGLNQIQSQIDEAIKKDASQFNRKQKPGFITMSLSYKPGNKQIAIPPSVVKELEQYYTCNKCQCRYSFLGSAYFCPACGNENTDGNVKEWIRNISNYIQKYSEIKESLASVLSDEDSASYTTQLLEEHYCKIVSAFQVFAEGIFKNHKGSENIKIRRNMFQNLDESSEKWKELTTQSYQDIFVTEKYLKLKEHFQIRHLLMHTSGIIDESFIKKVNKPKYKIGVRILLKVEQLNEFLSLIQELMQCMKDNWI